ncbi:MAG: GGDEF domain-containing protein [Bryobacteraceae bacterium]|nr:GGDEF domain-containing protein [Bryobacteraceae bacterium]
MDLDALQLQIFVSLLLLLGALFVALVCDFLKGNNEVLREHTIELLVRQEERSQREPPSRSAREQPAARISLPAPESPPSPRPPFAPERPASPPVKPPNRETSGSGVTEPRKPPIVTSRPEPEVGVQKDAETQIQPHPKAPPPPEPPPSLPRLVETAPEPDEARNKRNGGAKVMSIDTIERCRAVEGFETEEDVAGMTEEEPSDLPAEAVEEVALPEQPKAEPPQESEFGSQVLEAEAPDEAAPAETRIGESPREPADETFPPDSEPPVEPETGVGPVTADAAALAEAVHSTEPPQEREQNRLALPSGMQGGAALEEALQSALPFCGTVIAVGFGRGRGKSGTKPQDSPEASQAVERLIESLLTDQDAAFASGEDEYLIVLPNENGPKAHRRLQYVSESLWDYQIRSVGTASILFYWGSSEAEHELFATLVAAAKERMYQTKRTRERPPAEIHHYRLNVIQR